MIRSNAVADVFSGLFFWPQVLRLQVVSAPADCSHEASSARRRRGSAVEEEHELERADEAAGNGPCDES